MTAPPSACASVRTPCSAASWASARVLSPLPRRMTSGISRGCRTSATAVSRPAHAHQLDCRRVKAGRRHRRTDDLVDQHGRRPDRAGSGPQHARVARLDQLRGDVHDDVGPGLEIRADDTDRAPPLVQLKAVRQVPDERPGRLGRDVGERPQLIAPSPRCGRVQGQPVHERVRQPVRPRRAHVVGVRGQHDGSAPASCAAIARSASSRPGAGMSPKLGSTGSGSSPAATTAVIASLDTAAPAMVRA